VQPDSPWFRVAAVLPEDAEDPLIGALGSLAERGFEVMGALALALDPSLGSVPEGWARFGIYAQSEEIEDVRLGLAQAVERLSALGLVPDGARMLPPEAIEPGWQFRWKEYFTVSPVTDRITIRPTWLPHVPRPGEVVIDLDPGAAFGTGTHATTRLCLVLLDQLAPFERVFDVGTGSGVLAVAAARLGAREVLAVDTDPLAVEVATENVAANSVTDLVRVAEGSVERGVGAYDVLVANILAPTLIGLREALVAQVRPGGHLVLSGVLIEEGDAVEAAFCNGPVEVCGRENEGEWTALLLRRRDEP
jgi:ribosomal protein L11 methyltransferase